jgi:hypothetical protein
MGEGSTWPRISLRLSGLRLPMRKSEFVSEFSTKPIVNFDFKNLLDEKQKSCDIRVVLLRERGVRVVTNVETGCDGRDRVVRRAA